MSKSFTGTPVLLFWAINYLYLKKMNNSKNLDSFLLLPLFHFDYQSGLNTFLNLTIDLCVCVGACVCVDIEELVWQLIWAGCQLYHLSVDASATPVGLLRSHLTDLITCSWIQPWWLRSLERVSNSSRHSLAIGGSNPAWGRYTLYIHVL